MSEPHEGSFQHRLETAWLARGLLARLLWPLSLLFRVVIAVRRACYRLGLRQAAKLDVPVLVVGNIIVGGAGKTPTVIACVERLRAWGYTPGIISRGYVPSSQGGTALSAGDGREREVLPDSLARDVGDEPLLLHLRTRAPVVVGRDRVAAARKLLARHPQVDVIVSDDGLQHLNLPRRASVLVFDERGVGNGWLLPAGPLREPLPSARPAQVVLYNAPRPSTPLAGFLAGPRLSGAVRLERWWDGRAAPSLEPIVAMAGSARPGTRLVAMAGVARPERFFSMLEGLGLRFERLPLPDHHALDPGASMPWAAGTTDVLVTEKDAVKLRPGCGGDVRIWVVALDFQPERGFDAALATLFPPRPL